MYELAFVCMLFLQLAVYSTSYYVTQAVILKKLQGDIRPLSSLVNYAMLLGVSLGSLLCVLIGLYLLVIGVSAVAVVVSAYLWLTD